MAEQLVAGLLQALRRLVRQVGLYPSGHPLTSEAVTAVQAAVADLIGDGREVTITILEDAFYLDRSLLPHTSLEFHGLLREMQERGVDAVTFVTPVSAADLFDLASFIDGVSDDLPADGTVRLNDRVLTDADAEATPMTKLRAAYAGSLDALRLVSRTMATQGTIELSSVVNAVEGLFENTVSQSGAALLLATVKSHDEYTFFHSVNTCILSLAAGRLVGLDRSELLPIGVGAVLHDIGKVAVSTKVLQYPGRLDTDQWKEITLHPQEGALAIMAAGGTGHEIAATVAFEHHARFDGSGYPVVTRARRPHVFSRLVSVVDTYDAVTTRRSYRRAETPQRGLQVLLNHAGTMYDPDLVRVFISMMGIYPPGSILELTSGETFVVTDKAETDDAPLAGLMVKDRTGAAIEPEPARVEQRRIVRQVLAQQAGIDPASLLERLPDVEVV